MNIGFLFVLVVISIVVMNRKGALDDGEFAIGLVFLLSAAAGILGLIQY